VRGWRTCRRRWTPAPPSWRQPWTSCSATPPQVRGRGGRAGCGRVDGGGRRVLFEQELTLLPAGLLLPTTPDCSNGRQLPGGEAAEDCGWPAGRDGEAAERSIASPPACLHRHRHRACQAAAAEGLFFCWVCAPSVPHPCPALLTPTPTPTLACYSVMPGRSARFPRLCTAPTSPPPSPAAQCITP
jgi:hypothetical protein